jgi:hypothetical protein
MLIIPRARHARGYLEMLHKDAHPLPHVEDKPGRGNKMFGRNSTGERYVQPIEAGGFRGLQVENVEMNGA